MYEVILGTCGIQQIGWATLQCPFTSEEGVGDALDSYAWDGKRVQRWNVSPHPYGTPWASGDVIGVCADMEAGTLSFVKNGVDMGGEFRPPALLPPCGNVCVSTQLLPCCLLIETDLQRALSAVAFSNIRNLQPGAAFFPALSISHGERSELNFGSQPFRYPVDGYQPIQVSTSRYFHVVSPSCLSAACGIVPLASSYCHVTMQALAIAIAHRYRVTFTSAHFCLRSDASSRLQDPPSTAQQQAAQYLLTALRRLVRLTAPSSDKAEQTADVFAPPSAAATAACATMDDIDMLVDGPYAAGKDTDADPRRLLSADDAVLLAAALARHLGPLVEHPYLVSRYVLPMLQVR